MLEDVIWIKENVHKLSFSLFKSMLLFIGKFLFFRAICKVEGRRDFSCQRICCKVHVLLNVKNLFRFAKKLSSYNGNLSESLTADLFVLSSETNHHKRFSFKLRPFRSLEGLAHKSSNPLENGSLLSQRKRKIATDEIQIILYLLFH